MGHGEGKQFAESESVATFKQPSSAEVPRFAAFCHFTPGHQGA